MDTDKTVTANFTVSVHDVTITKSGNHPTLAWTHQAASVHHYEVYRSLTEPYFAPGLASWRADVATTTPTFTDNNSVTGADLTVAGASYFYAVVPMNAGDEPIGSANRTGAFVFGLVPGN